LKDHLIPVTVHQVLQLIEGDMKKSPVKKEKKTKSILGKWYTKQIFGFS
jgi:hypothetical protein